MGLLNKIEELANVYNSMSVMEKILFLIVMELDTLNDSMASLDDHLVDRGKSMEEFLGNNLPYAGKGC